MNKAQEQKEKFEGAYYHIYNRGTEKREIFMDERGYERFLECLEFFNTPNNRTVRDYKDSREFKNRGQTSGKSQRSDLCFLEFLDFKQEELEVKIEDYEKFVLDLIKDKKALEKLKSITLE